MVRVKFQVQLRKSFLRYTSFLLAVILLLLWLAKALHGKKDFVFEKNDQ